MKMKVMFNNAPRRWLRWIVAFVAILGALLLANRGARADEGDPPEVEAQRLAHLLGYIAADYGDAVSNGVVKVQAEYDEQLTLLKEARAIAVRLDGIGKSTTKLAEVVDGVRKHVDEKAAAEAVQKDARQARATVMAVFGLSEAPTERPNAVRGRRLFEEHCAQCHGNEGLGDGPKAKGLDPRPANYLADGMEERLTPGRVAATIRFGVSGTAMVPFTILNEEDRYAIAFYVLALRHQRTEPSTKGPTYGLSYLAVHTDAELTADLRASGVPDAEIAAVLSDLRRRAPYEDRGTPSSLPIARTKIERAKTAVLTQDRRAARALLVDAYLEGVEPAEPAIRATDPALAASLEAKYATVRADLESDKPDADVALGLTALVTDVARAEALIEDQRRPKSFTGTAFSSAGIVLREGVEAALLVAALLGLARQAGLGERRRYVHAGWITAIVLGLLTWFASARLIHLSGARRETVEGVTALLAMAVLFYVSYSLLAKREVARWMKFLREQVSPRRAALSLFGVALLAAYREAFETVLFYQALLASNASTAAALVGVAGGAVVLVALVLAYTRAGKFTPPQVFFRISSYLLYGLAVVFAGQGIAALQTVGVLPIHAFGSFRVPALGIHPTMETCAIQIALLGAAMYAYIAGRRESTAAAPRPERAA